MSAPAASVLVGFGHAAQHLHLRALRELGVSSVAAVDPAKAADPPTLGVPVHADLDSYFAQVPDSGHTCFHVAVGAAGNAEVAAELIARGAKRVIVEKPLAADLDQAHRLVSAARAAGAWLSAVAVWPHSTATDAVRRAVSPDEPLSVEFAQDKPRGARSVGDTSHRDALDVEMPHQVLLAVVLAGPIEQVEQAQLWDGEHEGRPLPGLGGARLVVRHRNGSRSTLTSDLVSPTRQRRLRVRGARCDLTVRFPHSAEATTSRVSDNVTGATRVLHDRPLTGYLRAAYRAFAEQPPASCEAALRPHLHALEVIATARALAGPTRTSEQRV